MADAHSRLTKALATRYRLERELGSGGMATVYLAEDLKHHRKVAVKVLKPELAATLGAERFTREIETAAAFQHPHILPLLDSGHAGGFLYYVMPYVEGESLRERLARHGELPIHDAVKILIEIADALAYAHARGVVHRDIKPDNVLLSGRHALVMDFGVAKAVSEAAGGQTMTTTGLAIGTPSYMAPEQAAADPHLDARADLYALGVLGYELIAGRPPFTGRSPAEILAAHVTQAPQPLTAARPACATALEQVIAKCLEKRPADRWQSAEDLLAALEPLATPSGGTTPTATRPLAAVFGRPAARNWLLTAVGVVLLGAGALVVTRPRAPTLALGRRMQVTLDPGLEIDPALSPDGKFVAYTAGQPGRMRLYLRRLDGGTPVPVLRDSDGFERIPSWSPDGSRLLFLSDRGIEIVPALGGAPRLLVPNSSAWPGPLSPDGRSFLYAVGESLYVRPLNGGPARLIVTAFEPHSFSWSPDGRWIAYVSGNLYYIGDASLGNFAPSSVWIASATGEQPRRVTDERSLNVSPVWGPQGRSLLYVSNRDGGRDVYAVGITRSGRARGAPVRLTTGANVLAISLAGDGGQLAYAVLTETSNLWSLPIPSRAPVSIAQAVPVTSGSQTIENASVSPDGRWLVFDSNRNGAQQIFRMPLAGGVPEQLTSDSTDVFAPDFSPDGRELVFHGFRQGRRQVFVMPSTGGPATQVTHVAGDERGPIWSPDGRRLAVGRDLTSENARLDIVTRNEVGRWSEPRSLPVTVRVDGRTQRCGVDDTWAWSPDGRWVALTCGGKGPGLVLVSPDDGATRQLVSDLPRRSARSTAWSADGLVVYYLVMDGAMVRSVNAVAAAGGSPRVLVRFDDPSRPWHRFGFLARGGRLYFTLGDLQSDIWVAELNQP